MPLSLGTPSQLSLFRHIADPKKYSTDKLKQIKSNKDNASAFSNAYRSRSGGAPRSEQRSVAAAASHRSRYTRKEVAESEYHAEGEGEEEVEEDRGHQADGQDDDVESLKSEQDQNHDYNTQTLTTFDSEKSQVQHAVKAEEDREKLEFLNELKKYRGQTTREFSVQDSLTDIQFEYDRLKAPENAANVVRIMGIVLQVIVYAVQWGNNKFGPLLKLDNGETSWAMQTGESISNHEYDSVLEKLYRKHWRKGSMSPEAELGMMLIGSAGVFHFQTHVNEKLNKKGSGSDSNGGFNLMGMLGPIMGLMGGGGNASKGGSGSMFASVVESAPPPAPPTKKFDFIAGRSVSYPETTSTPSYPTKAPPPSQPAPAVPPQPSLQAFTDLEQQFARKQQEMMDRLEQVTRRADEQMRMSQARQMDLERQLQQTQIRLHHQQQQVQQQQMQQQQMQLLQQQRAQQQQQQQQVVIRPSLDTEKTSPPPAPPSPEPVRSSNTEDDEAPSEEEEEHKDVKEVMVTEKQKRRSKPVALEIDELSICL